MNENEKINFDIDYSNIDPKKLNGNKKIVKSFLLFIVVGSCFVIATILLNFIGILDSKFDLKMY